MSYTKISILMPAFNEEKRIAGCIKEVVSFFNSIELSYEIIVMDDGSTDNTFQNALNLTNETVRVFQSVQNGGKGLALKNAFRHAKGDLILFLDADLDIHPNQFVPLFAKLNGTNAQVVIGSKQHRNMKNSYPLIRRILSKGYAFLVETLFRLPFRDTQTGIKLFDAKVLHSVFNDVRVKGYAFDLELLMRIHRCGFTIAEAPVRIDFGDKRNHMTPKVILGMLRDTMSILFRFLY